ncbi:YybH family protein [Rubritalea spongiae]|uniref:YybH family protein n=1 Tax=Rubritalea spongiae TaxID=430797 RepID=A0ABW5E2S0_9BACT
MKCIIMGMALSLTFGVYAEEEKDAVQLTEAAVKPEWEKLKSAAAEYVKAFNNKDAGAIAELFSEEGEILLAEDVKLVGQDAIAEYYNRVFNEHPDSQVGLEATSVHFETPELVVEEGAVVFSEGDEVLSTHFYVAIIGKQEDGTWKILQSRNREVLESTANKALVEIGGLVGDWVARWDDSAYKVDFKWDPSGAWIVGNGRYISPDTETVHIKIRIGWDAAAEQMVSWSFDSLGGHSHSVWVKGEEGWSIKAEGVNAQGETTSSKQAVRVEEDKSVIWEFTQREVAGEQEEDFEMRLVKTPPKPFTSPAGE